MQAVIRLICDHKISTQLSHKIVEIGLGGHAAPRRPAFSGSRKEWHSRWRTELMGLRSCVHCEPGMASTAVVGAGVSPSIYGVMVT